MGGCQLLHRFARDRRAFELDYMLSLFIFIVSLAFTFLVLSQYLELKHGEVNAVNKKLTCLGVLDDLTGSPGWIGGRSDWERWSASLDLREKVNDQSFFLGLRKNDRFFGYRIVIPGAADGLKQTASQPVIDKVVTELGNQQVVCIALGDSFRVSFEVETSKKNASIAVIGSTDNATTRIGSFYAGSWLDVWITDTNDDGMLRYDTVVIGGNSWAEGSKFDLGGREFEVLLIDQERVLLEGEVPEGYVLPYLDHNSYRLAQEALRAADVKYDLYDRVISGGSSSVEYTVFSKAQDKFLGQITDLSSKKIQALRDDVGYEIAKASLGVSLDFHVRITRTSDGAILLDYGPPVPGETESSQRDVRVEGEPCTVVVNVW